MRGYVYVTPEGCKDDQSLGYWIQLCLDFNPKRKQGRGSKLLVYEVIDIYHFPNLNVFIKEIKFLPK